MLQDLLVIIRRTRCQEAISNTKYIQVVKIGSKVFAIAVAKDTVTYLCELNEDELVHSESSSGKMLMNSESFKDILEKFKKDKPES